MQELPQQILVKQTKFNSIYQPDISPLNSKPSLTLMNLTIGMQFLLQFQTIKLADYNQGIINDNLSGVLFR